MAGILDYREDGRSPPLEVQSGLRAAAALLAAMHRGWYGVLPQVLKGLHAKVSTLWRVPRARVPFLWQDGSTA